MVFFHARYRDEEEPEMEPEEKVSVVIVEPDSKPDLLKALIEDQSRFMTMLGIPPQEGEYLNNPIFKSAVDGVVTEAAEVLSALSVLTKPWKRHAIEDIRSDVLEESVDVLFMLLEVFILAKITPEQLVKMYHTKLRRNLDRIASVTNHSNPAMEEWMKELDNALSETQS